MNEKYFTSLEVSKQMKEAGFEQEGGDAYWIEDDYEDGYYPTGDVKSVYEWRLIDKDEASNFEETIRAFSVGELGDELPEGCRTLRLDDKYMVFRDRYQTNPFRNTESKTEADARGLMAIELKKRGLL